MTKSSFYPGTDYEPVEPPAPAPAPPGSGNDAAPSSFFKGSLAYDAVDDSDFVGPPGEQGIQGAPGTPGADGADGLGVPAGGTTGQLLAKVSNADNDTDWVDPTGAVDSVFARTGAVVAVAGDYTATQITNTPAGAIAATTVQAALNELDTEKAASVHTHAQSDITNLVTDLAAKAALASPALTGNPTAPTQSAGNNSTRLATTAYVDTAAALKSDLASPTFTGDPKAPTPTAGDNDTSIATTAFVRAALPTAIDDLLLNGNGQVAQVALSGTYADGAYAHDQWVVLTQSNAITPSQLTDPVNGLRRMIRLSQANASAQRMGGIQPIEGQRCKDFRGSVMTLLLKLRLSTTANVKYAVVEWTGTEDSPTKDVVNDWTSSTYTTGNFFISTTTTIAAVGTQACTAATFHEVTANVTLSSSLNNVLVFVWTEGTVAQNVTLDVAANFLPGYRAHPLRFRQYANEEWDCKRYYNYPTGGKWNATASFVSGTATAYLVPSAPQITPPMRTNSAPWVGNVGGTSGIGRRDGAANYTGTFNASNMDGQTPTNVVFTSLSGTLTLNDLHFITFCAVNSRM